MKKFSRPALCLVFLAGVVLANILSVATRSSLAMSQTQSELDDMGNIPAVAQLCPLGTNGIQVGPVELKAAYQLIESQGCEAMAPIYLQNGRIFLYGTRVLIGEGK